VTVVLTLDTDKTRINIHKRNNTKKHSKTIKNTGNKSTLIAKTPTHTASKRPDWLYGPLASLSIGTEVISGYGGNFWVQR
jgi:hypothetical protein